MGGVGAPGSETLRGHGVDTRDEVLADSIALRNLLDKNSPADAVRASEVSCSWVGTSRNQAGETFPLDNLSLMFRGLSLSLICCFL